VLRQRFQIRRITVVADRGMISQDTIQLLTGHEQAPFDYVLGCRMRRQKEVNEVVLARANLRNYPNLGSKSGISGPPIVGYNR
jgi:hypothetical protein